MSTPPPRRRRHGSPIRPLVVALAVLLAGSVLAAASVGSGASIHQLPAACSLLSQAEAQALTGVAMLPGDDSGSLCIYNSDPAGPTGQVQVSVTSEVPRTLEVDRGLGHTFTSPPGLGDEAFQEDYNIFVRTGAVWVAIALVTPNDAPVYEQPLRDAAALASSRVPAGAGPAPPGSPGSPAKPATPGPPEVVGALPAGGGRNARWPGKQKRFGGNLDDLESVVFQPDAVLIGGGAGAIRDVSDDGLTWTVAGGAPGAKDLKVGKIMAATTLATGRVVALKKAGPNLRVTLGPVSLTQLIRKATLRVNDAPLKQPIYYRVDLPSAGPRGGGQAVTAAGPAGGKLTTTPICCTYTGIRLAYDSPAGRMAGSAEISVPKPTVDFSLIIDGGRLQEASFRLNGTAAFDFQIDGATLSKDGNFKATSRWCPSASRCHWPGRCR